MNYLDIKKNPYYKKFLKDPWTYTTGAVILGLLNIAMLASSGSAWGVTTPFSYWGAWIYKALGGHPENWFYFQQKSHAAGLSGGFLNNGHSVSNIGIIAGALLATLLASQFKIKKIKSMKQVVAAILGGLLMGYGARIAFGCNIGALFSGVASMSLHGWVYMIFIFFGAWVGSKLLVKHFI
ncbi:YeeE/YedE thiosulfate transporter family protein [Clostridium peptidivorans]|uniref:YeeE/YedE thiosulfate transporter family protein n=1 Tax=Clostridium peptidivorans TaxID=100174 RepID=UPI001FA9390B|nr:YeeE/YedE thiosulfate transporter family protein [Clostridium peptidivorans]